MATLATSRYMTSVTSVATMLTSSMPEVQAYSVQIVPSGPCSARTVRFPHQSSLTSLTFPLSTTPRQSVRSPRRNRNSSLAYTRENAPRHFSMASISPSSMPSNNPVFLRTMAFPLMDISCKNNVSVILTTPS